MASMCRRVLLTFAAVTAALTVVPAIAAARLQIGLQDNLLNGGVSPAASAPAYQALHSIAGSVVRINVTWDLHVSAKPLDPTNPADRNYRWAVLDEAIRRAAQNHLQVLLMLFRAPVWAEGSPLPADPANVGEGAWEPNPVLFGQFVHAVAERYSGNFPDPTRPGNALPRVKYYELWNEPNLGGYLAGPNQVGQLRDLVNAGYSALKAVNKSNVAAIGGLAPISPVGTYSEHPLTVARGLLCLRLVHNHYTRIKGCSSVHFDAFAVHPYALAATPTKPANNPDDILIHDVYKLHDVIQAARRLHTIGGGVHPIWNTEWSWFTDPPQTQYGDPPNVAARYVAYSMYEMWKANVTLVIWQVLADVNGGPNPGGGLESGVGMPKPTMAAFRFPFIASARGHKGYAWGRAPVTHGVKVFVQSKAKGGKWHRVATVHTGNDGVFQAHFRVSGNGTYRAQVAQGPTSLAYFSAAIPPRRTHPYAFG